jgi:nucleoside-diphosphate-sugar epimerase
MNKVLISGGLGFIGNVLSKEFLRNNWNVVIIDNETTYNTYEPLLHYTKVQQRKIGLEDARHYNVDIFDVNEVSAIIKGECPDVVVNLANMPIAGVAVEQPVLASDTMVRGLIGLLDASKSVVSRFVNVSSSMVYGDFLTDPVPEDQLCNPQEIYGNLKVAGERIVRTYTKLHGLEHAIVRPSACYGPSGNEAFVITKFLREAMKGGTININGIGTKLDFTFVTDIAHGIYLAATKQEATNETFNVTCGNKRGLTEVADILKNWYPELTVNITDPNKLYPKRGQLSIEKANKLLGYESKVQLEEGLKIFHDFLKD